MPGGLDAGDQTRARGGIIGSLLGSVDVTPGALGALLGVVGYFLGSRRLAVAAVVLGVAAVFFAAAASTGLIPGIQPPGHSYNG